MVLKLFLYFVFDKSYINIIYIIDFFIMIYLDVILIIEIIFFVMVEKEDV